MMEWTLILLIAISAVLLIVSIISNRNVEKQKHKEIDLVHVSVMKDINNVHEQIRNLELDIEVVTKEAGVQLTPEEIIFKREVLDLYKRKYSIETIAQKKQVSESEINQFLAPYLAAKDERSKIANEI
jgi:LAS superfamily LD-carboxypeptidase LdcB